MLLISIQWGSEIIDITHVQSYFLILAFSFMIANQWSSDSHWYLNFELLMWWDERQRTEIKAPGARTITSNKLKPHMKPQWATKVVETLRKGR